MTDLSRRGAFGAALVGTASLALPQHAALAATDPAQPGFYRYRVGDAEVTVISDGVNRMPITDAFLLNATKDDVNAALAAAFLPPNVLPGPYNPVLVRTAGKLALIDTGTGDAALAATQGLTGHFSANLAAAGIAPGAIDVVVISHYHGDHINGLLRIDGTPAFPNAEILVPAGEHAYWTDDGERARAPTQRIRDTFANVRRVFAPAIMARLRTYEVDRDIIPGLQAVSTPGHTPGHVSHVLSSGNASVFIQADVTHAPFLFVRNPGWHNFYDHDPVMAEATRRRVYDRLAADRTTIQGFHYPFPAVAHVEKTATGYREMPVPWMSALSPA